MKAAGIDLEKSLDKVSVELNELDWKENISPNNVKLSQHISAFSNLPGGGFVGGLVFATGVITQFIVSGMLWVESKSRIRPQNWLAVGLLLAVGAGVLPMFFGKPFLTAMIWEPVLPFYGQLHFSSVLIFDLGVFTLVVGTTTYMLVALAHQSLRFYRKNIYAETTAEHMTSTSDLKSSSVLAKNN